MFFYLPSNSKNYIFETVLLGQRYEGYVYIYKQSKYGRKVGSMPRRREHSFSELLKRKHMSVRLTWITIRANKIFPYSLPPRKYVYFASGAFSFKKTVLFIIAEKNFCAMPSPKLRSF